jgi:alkylation response protein AidB-like acyl-CoA dehydrogenase
MAANGVRQEIADLLPRIRDRRDEIEKARRIPRDVADSLRNTGLFTLAVPRVFGGDEAEPADILDLIETVSATDGSTGWCAMIGIANNVAAGYLPEAGAREVFTNFNGPSAGIAAPTGGATRVDGGVRVSGRWGFGSGITHSDWLWAGAMVMENGKPRMTPHGPEIIHIFVPTQQAEIHDTWHVSGLNGTGSHDFSVMDVFVPESRIFSLFDKATHRSEPLFQLPSLGWFVSQVAAVSLGIARAALDELNEIAQKKVPTLSQAVLADKPVAQIEIARAEAKLGAARAFLYAAVDELWKTACAGRQPSLRQIAMNRVACLNATATGADVARTANVLAGGSSIYTASSLQRHMRDADAITHHFSVAPHVWEDAGRVLLGREPTAPVF